MVGGRWIIVKPTDKLVKTDGIVIQSHGRRGEPQLMELGETLDRPEVRVIAADASPRHLEHRAHGHAGRPAVERIAARGRHEHRIHVKRSG